MALLLHVRAHRQDTTVLRGNHWLPCPVAARDLVILHGGVAHMSHANTSAASYSVHSIDMACEWSSTNCIQRRADDPQVPARTALPHALGAMLALHLSLQAWLAKGS